MWEGSGVISTCINKERSDSHISEFKPPSPTWEVSLDRGGILCGGGGRGGEERRGGEEGRRGGEERTREREQEEEGEME